MKIKMYTKTMCFPFEGAPYEKTMCVVYDSVDDINMVDVEDISKIALVKDAEVSYRFGDTDGNLPLRKPVVYPYIAQDPMFVIKKLCEKWSDQIGKQANLATKMLNMRTSVKEFESWTPAQLRKAISRKLTLADLHHEWLQLDYDGVSTAEENAFKWIYGPKEKQWRAQREFFEFVVGHDNVEKIALFTAAQAVFDSMRNAGEDEETVRAYKQNFVIPAMKKHR